jgi:Restriction endonuclease
MPLYEGDQAVVITNQYFTKPAIELAAANNVLLIDRDRLQQLIKNAVNKYYNRIKTDTKQETINNLETSVHVVKDSTVLPVKASAKNLLELAEIGKGIK